MNDYRLWGETERLEAERARALAVERGVEYVDLSNYPLDAVIVSLGVDYFTSTVDYAIALAIYEGYGAITLYGVNMISGSEYAYQKPGVDFWCGYAVGSGIALTVHGRISSVMKTRDGLLYGYGTEQPSLRADSPTFSNGKNPARRVYGF